MPTFSLQEVTELQIQNINDDNFRSWPEDNLKSYNILGSTQFVDPISSITTFDYSSETELNTTLTYTGTKFRSMIPNATDNYGYFSGGASPVNGRSDVTRRLEFSTDTISLPGNNMPLALSHGGSINTQSYGYSIGGSSPPLDPDYVCNILRLDFSTEQWSDLAPNGTPDAKHNRGVVGNEENAYINGGILPAVATRHKFDLATEEISSLPNYPVAGGYQNGISTKSDGYIAGGFHPSNYYSSILKTDFSNDTVYNAENSLPGTRAYINSFGNFSFGYFANGKSGSSTLYSDVSRLDLSSKTVSTIDQKFSGTSDGFSFGTAFSGYKSVLRPSGYRTFGYLCGGDGPSAPFNRNIYKFEYSSKTFSDSGQDMPVCHFKTHAASSHNHGYVLGGQTNTSSDGGKSSRCFRVDFSSDIPTELTSQLPFERNRGGSFSNTEYAYLTGGAYNIPFTLSRFHRMDFSNETFSDLYISHITNGFCHSAAAVTDGGLYGYVVGGQDPGTPPSIEATYSTISRIDMSSHVVTRSPVGKRISNSIVVQNNLSGYFLHNVTSPSLVDYNTHKLDFSDGTFSDTGSPIPKRSNVNYKAGAVSGNYYGYTTGGYYPSLSPPNHNSEIREFDYFTYTEEVLPSPMPAAIQDQVGFSNSAVSTN